MASEEIEFLRDQVKRLNAVVAHYQQKHPLDIIRHDTELPDTPWQNDRNLMSPLLTEYDGNIQMLNEQVESYKTQQKDLKGQIDKLVTENRRLTREIKETVQSQLESIEPSALQPDVGDDQILQSLQQQLQMALQEKDSAMEMWQASAQEIERLEHELKNKDFNPNLDSIEQHANQIKEQYVKTVAELNNEITVLQAELRKSKTARETSDIQVGDLKQMLEEMKNHMFIQEHEKSAVTGTKDKVATVAGELHKRLTQMESRTGESHKEIGQLKKDKGFLEQRVVELQTKAAEHEQREYEAVLQVRDSVQMVESAMLEKDQALQKQKQCEEEAQRLETALAKLVDEAGARTRQEVDSVKKQCNNNISRLMEEIHNLEMESSERQAQMERAIREKRAVESELEKIYQDGLMQGKKDGYSYDDLNARACNAERLRDEYKVKTDSMEQQMRRMEMTLRQEREHLKTELEQVKDRLNHMGNEFELANQDRVKQLEYIDELKKKMQLANQEKNAAQRNLTKELTCMQHDFKQKEQDYEVKLQALEDSHRHAALELRQLLASQQRMSAKWKEECQTITGKFETKVSDLRSELTREKKRNGELTKLLKETKEKTAEAEQMLQEYTRNIKRLEERIRDSDSRVFQAHMQYTKHLRKDKERNIVEERRQLQRQLERSLAESKIGLNL